jgi:hypothetical protein
MVVVGGSLARNTSKIWYESGPWRPHTSGRVFPIGRHTSGSALVVMCWEVTRH